LTLLLPRILLTIPIFMEDLQLLVLIMQVPILLTIKEQCPQEVCMASHQLICLLLIQE